MGEYLVINSSSELSWISQLWKGIGIEIMDWRWVDNREMGR
jgi:hypothetical protein